MPPYVPGAAPRRYETGQAASADRDPAGEPAVEDARELAPADDLSAEATSSQAAEPTDETQPDDPWRNTADAEPWAAAQDPETPWFDAPYASDTADPASETAPPPAEPVADEPAADAGAWNDEPRLDAEPWTDEQPLNAEPWASDEVFMGSPFDAEEDSGRDRDADEEQYAASDADEEVAPDEQSVEQSHHGTPTGGLPEAFFADAFYTPHVIEQTDMDDGQEAERVMAEQVAERLADLSIQIRERGFSALAQTVDPDQLSRIIAGMVAGYVARAEPDE